MPQFEYFLRSRHDVIQFGAAQSIEEGANPSEPGPRPRSTQSKNRFKKLFCPFCDKLSSDSWKFKRHLRSHSRSSGDRTAHDHDVGNKKPLSNVLTRKSSTGSGCDGNDCDSCECGCEVRPHNDSHFILKRLGIVESCEPRRKINKYITRSNQRSPSLPNIVVTAEDILKPLEENDLRCDLVEEPSNCEYKTALRYEADNQAVDIQQEVQEGSKAQPTLPKESDVHVNLEGCSDGELVSSIDEWQDNLGNIVDRNVDLQSQESAQPHTALEEDHISECLPELPIECPDKAPGSDTSQKQDLEVAIGSLVQEEGLETLHLTDDGLFRIPLPRQSPAVHSLQTPRKRHHRDFSSPLSIKRTPSSGYQTPDQSSLLRYPLSLDVPESPLYSLPRTASELPRLCLTPNLGLGPSTSRLTESILQTPTISGQWSSPFIPVEVMSTPFLMQTGDTPDVPDLIHMLDNEAGTIQAFEHNITLYDQAELTDANVADYVMSLAADQNLPATPCENVSPQRRLKVTQSVVKGRFGKRATGEMLEYLKAEQREKSRMKRKLNKEKSDTAYLENSIKQRISKGRGRKTRALARICEDLNIQPAEEQLIEEEE